MTSYRTYTVELFEKRYTYRGLTRGEALQILRDAPNQSIAEDMVVAYCVLSVYDPATTFTIPAGKVDWPRQIAGLATRLAEEIQKVSGLSKAGAERLRAEAHQWIQTANGQSEMLMMGLFGLQLSQIHAMDPEEWMRTAVAAETLYELQNGKPSKGSPGNTTPSPPTKPMPPAASEPSSPARRERKIEIETESDPFGTLGFMRPRS